MDGDSALLLSGELGEHRERKHLRSGLFSDREVAGAEVQSPVRLREMERDLVVDARSDARGGQL